MNYRKEKTQHDKISLLLTYRHTTILRKRKKNNVYQPHNSNIQQLYNNSHNGELGNSLWNIHVFTTSVFLV
jgi:hypothetical protein